MYLKTTESDYKVMSTVTGSAVGVRLEAGHAKLRLATRVDKGKRQSSSSSSVCHTYF